MVFAVGWAHSQEDFPTQAELLTIIKQMQQQIADLQKTVKALQDAPAPIAATPQERVATTVEQKSVEPNDFRVYWKDGLRMDTQDGHFKLRIGGRTQIDWGWFDDGNELRAIFGDADDAAEFRRARLYVSGTLYENFSFKAQYDFAGGDADFADVWVALNNIPYVGQLKVGHFYESFTLEQLTSDNYLTFLERSLANAFSPQRNMGAALANTVANQRMTWTLGVFRQTDSFGDGGDDGGYNVTARITGLPWYRDEGRKLLHIGGSYSVRHPDDTVRFSQRPEVHMIDMRFVNTGDIPAERVDLHGAELALVYGPFSIQGEYMGADVVAPRFGNPDFDGYYVQASVFLTGEHRPYDKKNGVFGRVHPNRDFGFGEGYGWGAWELGVRYSNLDLNDSLVRGGEEDNLTLGLTWYANPAFRVMINYIMADIDRSPFYDDDFEALTTRFQVIF